MHFMNIQTFDALFLGNIHFHGLWVLAIDWPADFL